MDNHYETKDDLLIEQTKKYLNKIAYDELNNKENIMDLLNYENVSLWWYLDLPLYYRIKNLLFKLDLNGETSKNNKHFKRIKIYFVIFFGLIYLVIKTFIRFIYGKLTDCKIKNGNKYILAPNTSLGWRESTYDGKKKKDQLIGDVIDELNSRDGFTVIACDICEDFPNFGIKKLIEKRRSQASWKPIECYLNLKILRKIISSWFYYIKKWKKFTKQPKFEELFKSENFNLYLELEDIFSKFFYLNLFNILLQIELIKTAITEENIDLTFTACDHCVFGRSTLIAGNQQSIPTVSLQTSLIAENGREYLYSNEEIKKFPLPQFMALMGGYYKELLCDKSSYPNDMLIVTGQPRYDFLKCVNYSKVDFCKKNFVDYKKKIILVTTQPYGLELPKEINDSVLNAILRLEKNVKNMEIIIKPHPREKSEYYRNVVGKNSSIHILDEKSDTYEAINASDILITFSSTTAMEAMILNKPIITLDLSNLEKTNLYAQYGAATLVKNEKLFIPTINELLYNDKIRKELFKRQNGFLRRFLYLQDGLSTKRFVDLIEEIVR